MRFMVRREMNEITPGRPKLSRRFFGERWFLKVLRDETLKTRVNGIAAIAPGSPSKNVQPTRDNVKLEK